MSNKQNHLKVCEKKISMIITITRQVEKLNMTLD